MEMPYLKGWDHSEKETVVDAVAEGRLHMIDMDFTNSCNMRCPYCYRAEYGDMSHKELESEMTWDEFRSIIDQARDLGCRSVKIVGAGEPTIDRMFKEKVSYISRKGMIPVIFTNGLNMTPHLTAFLFENGASVILKFSSLNDEVQDRMVGIEGYGSKLKSVLKTLQDTGFAKCKPTRLGMDSVITRDNTDDIAELFRYCRKNNIFPVFKSFIPTGDALRNTHLEISREDLMSLLISIKEIDKNEFGLTHNVCLPYLGGFPCSQLHYALYIDIEGNVYPCPGSRELLGNIREQNLDSLWNSEKMLKIRNTEYQSCPPREEYWKSLSHDVKA